MSILGWHSYAAVVTMQYDDWQGKESVRTVITHLRARSHISAACRALRIAERGCTPGWEAARVDYVVRT